MPQVARITAMPLLRHVILLLALAGSLRATDVAAVLREAAAAEARFDSRAALELYVRADAARPNDPFILQRIARQYSDQTLDLPDPADARRSCQQALIYARRAHELAPKVAENILSLAICYAKIGFYGDARTKIENSRLVRQYTEETLALDPNAAFAHHILGQWHYEVASVGAAKRLLVKLIYGGLPAASTAEGVRHLRRAVELSPDSPSHRAELGLALLADGQHEAARPELQKALALPPKVKYDTEAKRRATEALEKLKS